MIFQPSRSPRPALPSFPPSGDPINEGKKPGKLRPGQRLFTLYSCFTVLLRPHTAMTEKNAREIRPRPTTLGILGGSFDPVHNGHLTLAREVKERFGLDRVVFVPAFHSPHKLDQEVASAWHRLQMLRLALQGSPGLEICEVELARRGPSYSIDTLDEIQALYPRAELNLIMGIDTFKAIHTWKEASRLLASCHLLVSTRPGYSFSPPASLIAHLPGESGSPPYVLSPMGKNGEWTFRHRQSGKLLTFFPIPPMDVASSKIRHLIRTGSSARNMLPPEVENYIIENRLYQAVSPPQAG